MVKLETVSCYAEARGKLAGVREAMKILYDNMQPSFERETVAAMMGEIEHTLESVLDRNARALANEVIDDGDE